jgi:hypothetical protein
VSSRRVTDSALLTRVFAIHKKAKSNGIGLSPKERIGPLQKARARAALPAATPALTPDGPFAQVRIGTNPVPQGGPCLRRLPGPPHRGSAPVRALASLRSCGGPQATSGGSARRRNGQRSVKETVMRSSASLGIAVLRTGKGRGAPPSTQPQGVAPETKHSEAHPTTKPPDERSATVPTPEGSKRVAPGRRPGERTPRRDRPRRGRRNHGDKNQSPYNPNAMHPLPAGCRRYTHRPLSHRLRKRKTQFLKAGLAGAACLGPRADKAALSERSELAASGGGPQAISGGSARRRNSQRSVK